MFSLLFSSKIQPLRVQHLSSNILFQLFVLPKLVQVIMRCRLQKIKKCSTKKCSTRSERVEHYVKTSIVPPVPIKWNIFFAKHFSLYEQNRLAICKFAAHHGIYRIILHRRILSIANHLGVPITTPHRAIYMAGHSKTRRGLPRPRRHAKCGRPIRPRNAAALLQEL